LLSMALYSSAVMLWVFNSAGVMVVGVGMLDEVGLSTAGELSAEVELDVYWAGVLGMAR
jgi:hypothetical protein